MELPSSPLSLYSGKKALIIGGLGFLGSNLAHTLVQLGAKVTILDNLAPLYGGNLFNIEDIRDKVEVRQGDVRDQEALPPLVKDADIIFNFAAQVSHIDSGSIPFEDLDINCRGHLTVLESVRLHNPKAKVVFSSSRLVLGKIVEDPITESHPTDPLSLYGVHKLTAEKYSALYFKNHAIRTAVVRITNPYGERQQIKHSKYSIPGWFMRLAMQGETITIFGDGSQLRDYIYATDIAEALALVGICDATDGQLYNLGSGKSVPFKEMVDSIVRIVGSGAVAYVPWPENYEKEETGSCEITIEKIERDTGWKPKTSLEEGISRMHAYYLRNKGRYLPE